MATENKYNLVVDSIPAGEPIILFRAQDKALSPLLECYAILCETLGSPESHVDHVRALRNNVVDWQKTHLTKAPD